MTEQMMEELEKLSSLKDKGILTQEEFDAQKKKLLEGDAPKAAATSGNSTASNAGAKIGNFASDIAGKITSSGIKEKLSNRKKNPRVEFVLKKDDAQDITVKCPQKIKLSAWQTYQGMFDGFPPLSIKPIDKMGVLTVGGSFVAIIAVPAILSALGASTFFMLVMVAGLVVLNAIVTKNYFYNFFQSKLADGYVLADESQNQFLQEAGLLPAKQKATVAKMTKKFWTIAAAAFAVVFILAVATGDGGRGNVVDNYLSDSEKVMTKIEKLADDYNAGRISNAEVYRKSQELVQEFEEIKQKYGFSALDLSTLTEKQKARYDDIAMRLIRAMSDFDL